MRLDDVVESADGTQISVSAIGEGEPIVLVHGSTGSADGFALVVPELATDFRVVTYDRRGRGRSGDRPDHALEREADDLRAVLAWAHGPVHLFGHSYGARVAMVTAPANADLASLVLYEPPLAMDEVPAETLEAIFDADRAGDWEEVLARFLPNAEITPDEIAFIRSDSPSWNRVLDGARTVARETRALLEQPPDLDTLRSVDVPALVIRGGETTFPIFLRGLDDVAAALGATIETIPGQRHIATAGAPGALATAIRRFVMGLRR